MSNSNEQLLRRKSFEDNGSKETWMKFWYQITEVIKTGNERILAVAHALSTDREQERIETVWRRNGY